MATRKKFSQLDEISELSIDDIIAVSDDPSGSPISKKAGLQKLVNLFGNGYFCKQIDNESDLSSEEAASGYIRVVSNTLYGTNKIFVAYQSGDTPNNGDLWASATSGWLWKRLTSGFYNVRDFGALGETETGWNATTNTSAFQAFFDALALTGGIGIIPSTYGGGDYVCDDHPKFQNKTPPNPIFIQCSGVIRLNALGTAGTVLLVRNSKDIYWTGGIIDGGSAEGVLGNNAIGVSGVSENGDQRSENIHFEGVTMRNCLIDPFLKGGKGVSFQSGVIDSGISNCVIQDCDIGFAHEGTYDEEGDRVATRCYYSNLLIKNCPYSGA